MTAPNTTTENAELARRLFVALEANDATRMHELLAPDVVGHGLPPELGDGPAAMTTTAALVHEALAECTFTIDDLIAERGRVAVRYTTRARHVSELFGAAPTGRKWRSPASRSTACAAAKVVEYRGTADMSGLVASSDGT